MRALSFSATIVIIAISITALYKKSNAKPSIRYCTEGESLIFMASTPCIANNKRWETGYKYCESTAWGANSSSGPVKDICGMIRKAVNESPN